VARERALPKPAFLQWEVWEIWSGGKMERIAAFMEKGEAELFQRKMIKARPRCDIEIRQGAKQYKPRG